jgi:uncharacterized protein YgiM (DUF1202 family)
MNSRQATHVFSWTVTPILTSLLLVLACSHRETTATATEPVAATTAASTAAPTKVEPVKKAPAKAPVTAPAKAPVATTKVVTLTPKVATPAKKPAVVATTSKTTMYVTTETLNVRSSPSPVAPVVAKLTRGSMFNVTVQGNWAKIGDGQYVSVKYLSTSKAISPKRKLAAK